MVGAKKTAKIGVGRKAEEHAIIVREFQAKVNHPKNG